MLTESNKFYPKDEAIKEVLDLYYHEYKDNRSNGIFDEIIEQIRNSSDELSDNSFKLYEEAFLAYHYISYNKDIILTGGPGFGKTT